MGFWDFNCFNKALLAKQSWRLWNQPDSLVAQIMPAKYYPNASLLDARVGRKPSFAWRSIHSSCGLLKEGLIWCVGNGSQIRIWKDRWLPNPSTYRVCPPTSVLHSDATVRELIDADLKWWNVSLLERIFSKAEALLIQTIPLSSTNQPDMLIWKGTTTNGVFFCEECLFLTERAYFPEHGRMLL